MENKNPETEEATSQEIAKPKLVGWEILNKTAKRILIDFTDEDNFEIYAQSFGKERASGKEAEGLVIPSFGTITVHDDIKQALALEPWNRQGFIELKEVYESSDDEDLALGAGLGCGMFFILFVAVGLIVTALRSNWMYWGIVGLVSVIGVALMLSTIFTKEKRTKMYSRARRQISMWVNLLVLLALVFGGIGYLVFQFNRPPETFIFDDNQLTLFGLERMLYFIFISIVSIFPAILYFLFRRRQLDTVEQRFIRDVMRLDPMVRTTTEANIKYGSLLQETYGGSQSTGFLIGPGAPILIATILIMIGWLITLPFSATGQPTDPNELFKLFSPTSSAVNFAFLGAYFFALGMIFRRYVRADLTPKAYTHIIIRLLFSIILTWILSASPFFDNTDNNAYLNIFAFIVGIFPDTGLTFLRNLLKDRLLGVVIPTLQDEHPLTRLEGINLFDQTRLLEEGIENVENLAHHNLLELLISTRIPAQRLVDMFDQAILYLHLGKTYEDVKKNLETLRLFGIRTATDLQEGFKAANENHRTPENFLNILETEKDTAGVIKEKQIQVILDVLKDDEWMQHIRYWRTTSTSESNIYHLVGVNLLPYDDNYDLRLAA